MGTKLLMIFILSGISLTVMLGLIFNSLAKSEKWEILSKSIFECGFSSYNYSRFSFSVQYFTIALTFLLLDLELCFLLPFFIEDSESLKEILFGGSFSLILTLALISEWASGFLDWKK